MKANEFRIGNLVSVHNGWGSSICKVYRIEIDMVYHGQQNTLGQEYNEHEPIPLTEEWLIKFGFKKSIHKYYFHDSEAPLYISLNDKTANWCEDYNTPIPCEYVHQLQNLYFALTGEELDIKE